MKKDNISFFLPISILREGKSFVAYTPALDISTAADTFEEVKKMFEEAVQLFIEEVTEKGTLEEVLLGLGWQKQNHKIVPPTIVANNTEYFSIPIN